MEKTDNIPVSEETDRATTPENNFTIPVKFNKTVRNLTVDEATELSQKGLKYESVENEFERLRALSRLTNKSVPEFLTSLEEAQNNEKFSRLVEDCGGNEETAKRIMKLENGSVPPQKGFNEFSDYFPDMKYEDIPESVIQAAADKNGSLLDEYLRFEAKSRLSAAREINNQNENAKSNPGTLSDLSEQNVCDNEFLKGLWGN